MSDAPASSFDAQETYPRVWSLFHVHPLIRDEVLAGFGIRSLAYLIDRVILNTLRLLFLIAGYAASQTGSPLLSGGTLLDRLAPLVIPVFLTMVAVEIVYYTYLHGDTGQTVGKLLCGLKVVDLQGRTIGYRRAFQRWVGYVLSYLVFGLGFFWVAVDRKSQGWHDKIAKSYVVRV